MLKKASIIIASRNEGIMLKQTIDSIKRTPTRIPYEIIVVDDGSRDDSFAWIHETNDNQIIKAQTEGLGIAPARNIGANMATGEILVFCDAHIEVEPYWLDEFTRVMGSFGAEAVSPAFKEMDYVKSRLKRFDFLAAAHSRVKNPLMCGRTLDSLSSTKWLPMSTAPFETPILSGGCWAVRAEVFRAVGGYEAAFRGYGGDEEEISLKLWLNGYTLYATPHTCVAHYFRPSAPYKLQLADLLHNRFYTALCHYKDERVQRIMQEHADYPRIQAVYDEVFTPENIEQVRRERFRSRLRDDDWFFSHFKLNL